MTRELTPNEAKAVSEWMKNLPLVIGGAICFNCYAPERFTGKTPEEVVSMLISNGYSIRETAILEATGRRSE